MGDKERAYYRTWWEKNKDRVLAHRKERYAKDPEYREKAAEYSRKSRQRKSDERKAATEPHEDSPGGVVAVRIPRIRKPEEVPWKGKTVKAYGIEVLCRAIGRSRVTIYSWERKGWLPKTPLTSSREEKLYTAGMIEVVAQIVRAYEEEGLSRGRQQFSVYGQAMHDKILAGWDALNGDEDVDLSQYISIRVPSVVTKIVEINGEQVECYTVEMLSRAIGRSKYMIPVWEKNGVIPRTPLTNKRGWRLYTADMIEVVRTAVKRRGGSILKDPVGIYEDVAAGWEMFGIEVEDRPETVQMTAQEG